MESIKKIFWTVENQRYMFHMDNHIHSEIIAMAWCDKTSFDVIEQLYGVSEPQVKALMKKSLKPSSYRLWRRRVYGRNAKHYRSKIKHSIWSKSSNKPKLSLDVDRLSKYGSDLE